MMRRRQSRSRRAFTMWAFVVGLFLLSVIVIFLTTTSGSSAARFARPRAAVDLAAAATATPGDVSGQHELFAEHGFVFVPFPSGPVSFARRQKGATAAVALEAGAGGDAARGRVNTRLPSMPLFATDAHTSATWTLCPAIGADEAATTGNAELLRAAASSGFLGSVAEDYAAEMARGRTFKIAAAEIGDPKCGSAVAVELDRAAASGGGGNNATGDSLGDEGYSLCVHADRVVITALRPAGVLYALHTLAGMALSARHFSSGSGGGAAAEAKKAAVAAAGLPVSMGADGVLVLPVGCVRRDVPKLPWRGQHLDTARHFHGAATVRALLTHMARLRLNVFHWHLSDDQGWRLESRRFPALHEVGGRRGAALNGRKVRKYAGAAYAQPVFHTQAEVAEILRFAAARNIVVVPEVDLPAHAAAMAIALTQAGHPEFGVAVPPPRGNDDCGLPAVAAAANASGAPNCMGGTFGMMLPTRAAVAVANEILNELMEVFAASPTIHLGGDEAEFIRDQVWRGVASDLPESGDAAAAAAAPAAKAGDFGALQLRLTRELIAAVERRGRRAAVWDETFVELSADDAPRPPTIAMLWRDDHVSVADIDAKLARLGVPPAERRVVLTPKTRLYFDYLQKSPPSANAFWPLQRPSPWAKHNAVTLKRAFMTHALVADGGPSVHGVEGCAWTELIPNATVLEYQLFPRMFALADAAWSARDAAALEAQYADFVESARALDRMMAAPRLR